MILLPIIVYYVYAQNLNHNCDDIFRRNTNVEDSPQEPMCDTASDSGLHWPCVAVSDIFPLITLVTEASREQVDSSTFFLRSNLFRDAFLILLSGIGWRLNTIITLELYESFNLTSCRSLLVRYELFFRIANYQRSVIQKQIREAPMETDVISGIRG